MKRENESAFFRDFSMKIGTGDPVYARRAYYALLGMITSELQTDREISLPRLGEFRLHYRKPMRRHDVNTKTFTMSPGQNLVKFSPNRDLRKYFKLIDDPETV